MRTVFSVVGALFFAPFISFENLHPFHVSVADISYNTHTKRIEWVQQIFLDDLEKTLQTFSKNPSLNINYPKNKHKLDSLIKVYYMQKITLGVNRKLKTLRYLGHEIKDGSLVSYLESSSPIRSSLKQIFIRNTVLFEIFASQKNLVHLTFYNFKKTLHFSSSQIEEEVRLP